jgi:hypothetical protein
MNEEPAREGSTPTPRAPPTVAPGTPPPEAAIPPRTSGSLIGRAFELYLRNAGPLLLIVTVVVVPLSLLSFLITYYGFAHRKIVTFGPTTSVLVAQPHGSKALALAALIAVIIAAIASAVQQAAIVRAAAQATIDDRVDFAASYRWGLRRFASVLLVALMEVVIVAIGFVLLVIPGIILLVLLAVSIPPVVVENLRSVEALRRSWTLTKDHFWHVFVLGLLELLIIGVVTGVLSSFGGNSVSLRLLFQMIGQVLVAPFAALVTVLLYFDLRSRVETLTRDQLRTELAKT